MGEDERFDLIEDIYRSALYTTLWPDTLQRLCEVVGGDSVALILQDLKAKSPRYFECRNLDPESWILYRQYYCTVDLWRNHALKMADISVAKGDALIDREDFLKCEWFNDFLRPLQIG